MHDDDEDVVLAAAGLPGRRAGRQAGKSVRRAWQEFRNATLLTTRKQHFFHLVD